MLWPRCRSSIVGVINNNNGFIYSVVYIFNISSRLPNLASSCNSLRCQTLCCTVLYTGVTRMVVRSFYSLHFTHVQPGTCDANLGLFMSAWFRTCDVLPGEVVGTWLAPNLLASSNLLVCLHEFHCCHKLHATLPYMFPAY